MCGCVTRRAIIAGGAAFAALPLSAASEKRLRITSIHTGEKVDALFWANGRYRPDALRVLERFMRDHRTGEVHPIDPELFDLLHRVQLAVGGEGKSFEMISGYRSPATNASLKAQGRAVATRSQHSRGTAIDVRLPGIDTDRLRAAGRAAGVGGVGSYPDLDFVHLDTGRVRFW
jgi:uncharacterized protein YcbK (DUF882 family)